MGENDIDTRMLELARQTRAALGDTAKVEVCRGDTTYRIWEEFKLRNPGLPVPDNGVPGRREFSMLPSEPAIQAYFAAQQANRVPAVPVEKTSTEETVKKEEKPPVTEGGDTKPEGAAEKKPTNKYKGENKPADKANWADLNGKDFEVIDEPDAEGNLPTRPIRGKITVEGEAKNGENPTKFTITDADNGGVYTFELDTSVTDKVVYKCTSGPGGKYSKGNGYDLRTINGVPMLVQMSDSDGYGVSVARSNASEVAAVTDEEVVEEENPDENPDEVGADDEVLTAEDREAKITDTAFGIMKSDFNPTTEEEKAALANYNEEKSLFVGANLNLAVAAYSEPKLEVKKTTSTKTESVTLPNGQTIYISRDAQGKIASVTIQSNKAKDTVNYTANGASGYQRLGNIPPTMYDWNKVLELAIRIFGETPTED